MSDLGRKDFSDKVQEKLTPQQEKSALQQGKEQLTSATDKVAQNLQPNEAKSDTQKFGDAIQKGHDDAKAQSGPTLTEQVTQQAGEYVEVAKDQLNNAAEYVANTLTGAKESANASVDSSAGSKGV
ncbi:12 kDa heat shock protein [Wickerhamomyces ciferrii]|uniref:12 kDa heat shock protein n=1 Tax=Wickerhamomyces ciferrii (strain ATCC 14091 / BCRC 22168 / CBS 111 / JCM 3599 / NBRC 0793 / NRRL Y-1031 F-60-10) TaxID=1206466 RepID=K0KIF7_WICCF|nr:12 kDa heat shock protein [Wickerhamomyces ciferrii]CCH40943.1 12 kDa heat shock protein [Wickerhamomyces ciferrii]